MFWSIFKYLFKFSNGGFSIYFLDLKSIIFNLFGVVWDSNLRIVTLRIFLLKILKTNEFWFFFISFTDLFYFSLVCFCCDSALLTLRISFIFEL